MAPYQSVFKRYEKKYLLQPEQAAAFRRAIEPYMRMDAYGRTTICSVYMDTPDFRLIRASLEKPLYKEKLRLRTYGIPKPYGTAFVEMKKKYKGVVYKRRVSMPYAQAERSLFAPAEAARTPGRARNPLADGEDSAHGKPRPRRRRRMIRFR